MRFTYCKVQTNLIVYYFTWTTFLISIYKHTMCQILLVQRGYIYIYIYIYIYAQSCNIYIYIYIYSYPQIVSLYHKSTARLDTRGASSCDQKPADLTSVWFKPAPLKEFLHIYFYIYAIVSLSAQFMRRALNLRVSGSRQYFTSLEWGWVNYIYI